MVAFVANVEKGSDANDIAKRRIIWQRNALDNEDKQISI